MTQSLLSLSMLFLAFISANGYAQDPAKRDPQQMHRLHNDPTAYMNALEDPKRDEYQKPHEVLTALNIKPGEVVADIGA